MAIGFTTHYEWVQGEMHLGGTHGALASHVLIRESPGQVSEPERLEVLVHELGHFLGAAHTSDKTSVMRPMLGDRQSAAKCFRIGFDAPNTLIMSLVAEEMRTRHIWHPERAFASGQDRGAGGLHGLGADDSPGSGVDLVGRIARPAAGAGRSRRGPAPK